MSYIKRNSKSSVFTHLFSKPKYRRELYLSLHPKESDVLEDEITTYTLTSIFTNIQVNDLGLLVKNSILVLVEAQSVWTLNILPRMLQYLGESYNRYVMDTDQNIYGSKKVTLPKPELYVLYTGSKPIKEKQISFRKEFFCDDGPIELRAKVITLKNSSKIVKEYISFTKILDKNNNKYNYSKQGIQETIKYCIKHNILREYLTENRKEVYNMMTSIYDQKTATYMYGREQYAEGLAEGRTEGRAEGKVQGRTESIVDLLKRQIISVSVAAKELNMTEKQVMKLVKKT